MKNSRVSRRKEILKIRAEMNAKLKKKKKTALAIQGLLCFHMNCEIFCPSSVENAIGNLIGIAFNL